jgi:hypothetical protein
MIAPDEFGGKRLATVPQPTPGLARDAAVSIKVGVRHF